MKVAALTMALLFLTPLTFESGKARIYSGSRRTELDVELALTMSQRTQGLMYREHLPENSGMFFLYVNEVSGSFWMKNTYIPLSIAFFDSEGRIMYMTDMEPLTTEPHGPGRPFTAALEVNRGWFEKNNISVGDTIEVFKDGEQIFP